jgi:chemotaxis protein MotC
VRRASRLLALSALALLAPATVFAEPPSATAPPKISDLVDDLQRMQVKVSQGDKSAYAAELNQLKTIGAAIAGANPETWKNKREADSLVLYILSGGALADVAPLLKGDALIESERSLARGALAYVTNHETDAVAQLDKTNLTEIDPRLAGPVAFARSVLETKRNPKKAVELLDWSRLVAPGGLVEEAALRREIALLADAKDASRLAMLTRQYVTRFSASLYAGEFLRDLARAVVRLGIADDPANYKLVASSIASLSAESRQGFLLNVAKSGIVNARFPVAASAATEALASAQPDSPEAARARLYLAAGRLFSEGYDAAIADLRTLPTATLDRGDADLLSAVRKAAAQLRAAPDFSVFNTQNAMALPDANKEAPTGSALTIANAKEALQRTSSLVSPGQTGGAP